ncbi:MAG: cobalt-precorrin-5B (C(1))-methyltransferase [Elusimicrobia bacterium]|nr:cobalt-precorrin-5B (C(1))-methyltransferase [Elusimicrobiota bacterium]
MLEPPKDKSKLRTGFTTGACSAAAAKAATLALIGQSPLAEVEITLPIGRKTVFKLEKCVFNANEATCSVVKDAGDDPDCTDGAELTATVSWLGEPGVVVLERGPGVGVVTKPGLGLDVGGPAINPIPRKNITEMTREAAGAALERAGIRVIISVPQGTEMAKKTLNARLGIIGGISILGTTGIVVPFSTAAYRASIDQGIDVTLTAGCDHIVLTTGGRSEEYAMRLLPDLKEEAFIQMGDFVGHALKYAAKKGIRKVTICGMPGKLSKIAAGTMMTHAKGSQVDLELLARIAVECGASDSVAQEIKAANTARHVSELVAQYGITGFFDRVCRRACEACRAHVSGALTVAAFLTDFDGKLIGRWEIA